LYFIRFSTIPFSSNLGKTLGRGGMSKQHTRAHSESLVSRYERSCLTRPFGNAKHGGKFKHNATVSRFPSLCVSKKKEDSTWSHSYCFSKADKRERMLTINSGIVHCGTYILVCAFFNFKFNFDRLQV